jgi:hypothetical protein
MLSSTLLLTYITDRDDHPHKVLTLLHSFVTFSLDILLGCYTKPQQKDEEGSTCAALLVLTRENVSA